MKLLLSTLALLLIAAWFLEMWVHKHGRQRRERDREKEQQRLARNRPWWSEPRDDDDLGDH